MEASENLAKEPIVQRRHVSNNDERQTERLGAYESVQLINVHADPRFVAIDEVDNLSENLKRLKFQEHLTTKIIGQPKREKTFDGADIYNVKFTCFDRIWRAIEIYILTI